MVDVTAPGNRHRRRERRRRLNVAGGPPTPATTSLTPTSGSTTGGTSVVITGTDFTGATAVTFGGTAATGYVVDSDTQITATSPAHAAGTVDVQVTTPDGTSANSAGYFDDFLARRSSEPEPGTALGSEETAP